MSSPTTSDPVIRFDGVSKVYRVFRHPFYQALGLFWPGLVPRSSYDENRALDGVAFEVPRGAKVGIIGKNGSGKSTLLKLAAGRVRPTAGRVAVNGKISSLLQLGTGFHPDFTGRQNVFAALAYMGVSGREAEVRLRGVVEFAELEHFIDQPVRAYSSGMAMRLAFAVATAIEPEVLLVDEVLSVGDSYFAHKCLERMRELAADKRTTVLFVSHNIYALTFLCDRFVWLEGGRVRAAGSNVDILTQYELSMREEEEKRLALKTGSAPANGSDGIGSGDVRIKDIWFEDASGARRHLFRRGAAMRIAIRFETRPDLGFDPVFDVGITREDGLTVSCMIFKTGREADTVRIELDELLLNQSNYFLTVLVFRRLDLAGQKNKFYTIDPDLCDAHIRRHEFRVEGSFGIETTVFRHPFRVFAGGAESEPLNAGSLGGIAG